MAQFKNDFNFITTFAVFTDGKYEQSGFHEEERTLAEKKVALIPYCLLLQFMFNHSA